jgi:putative transposase
MSGGQVRMRRAYRFRIYPSEEQRRILERTLHTCRILYNGLLAERRDGCKKTGRSPSFYEQKRGLTKRNNDNPYLLQVHSQVLQDVALRLERTFQQFFQRTKKGEKAGYPRFKGWNRYDSFTYPQYGNGAILKDGRLQLSKIGALRIFQHRPLPEDVTIKTCTIRRDVDKWYACFSVEIDEAPKTQSRQESHVGVDLGLNSLVTLSNGEKIKPPKFLRKMEKKLIRGQRRLARKRNGSENRRRQVIKLARIHRKIRLQRADFNHKLSRILVNRFDVIGFENLRIPSMMKNRSLAKSIADAGWGQLRLFTSYKAAEAGKIVEAVDSYGTTRDCSRCGFHVPKMLSERIHECPNCGLILDRDWNAARNVLKRVGWGTAESTPAEIQPLLQPRTEGASRIKEPGSPRALT